MSYRTNKPNPLVYLLEQIIEGRWSGLFLTIVIIPVLVLAVLLLPPISLGSRLMTIGYTRIDSRGGSLTTGGMEINFLPQGVIQSFRVKLDAIPRTDFLKGSAGNSLVAAAEAIPPNLILKSPYYRIQWQGSPATTTLLVVPLPKDIENPTTVDLYAWHEGQWRWLPNHKIPGEGIIESQLDFTPASVVVMSTHPINPNVSTDFPVNAVVPDQLQDTLVEINPQGLLIADKGLIEGDLQELPPEIKNSTLTILPTVRNWLDDGTTRTDLVDNMLIDDTYRQRHIRAIVDLVQRNAWQGVDLDYRHISPDLKAEYTLFLQELRQALPANKLLSVSVSWPQQLSEEEWETGAYDWQAIGRLADVVKVPTSPNPADYRAGGAMEALLDWATGQVNRYKIQLMLSTLSTEEIRGSLHQITYQQALDPLGSAATIGENSVALPGDKLDFTLGGMPNTTGIQFDKASGAYWYAFLDPNGTQRTIYLENAASIARKLQFVAQYNLRGVSIQGLLREDNDAQIWNVIRQFLELVIPPIENQYSVVWRVQGQDGGVINETIVDLSSPNYQWTVPEGDSTAYQVVAAIAANQDTSAAIPRGSVEVRVATKTPVPSPTPEPTGTPEATATLPPPPPVAVAAAPPPVEEAPPPPADAGPQPVAAAKGNLPFDYGIQADPRGGTAANVGLIKGMGFTWVKFQMAWKDVEPSAGAMSWGMWDDVIGAYAANGIKVMLSIPKAPDWARPGDDDRSVEGPPQDPATYANFVGQVAARYKGKVQAIEVWNEQNLYYEAGGQGRINPAAYTELLKQSYNAIKAVNPDMIVITGALTPTGAPPPVAMDDVEYLRQMYANGAKGFFDAVGAHPSGFANPPDALYQGGDFDPTRGYDDHRSFFFRNTMEEYRRVMVDNGDGDKTIWPTEFGWPVWRFQGDARFIFAQGNSLEQQAEFTVKAYQLGKEWGWVGTMFLWNLDYNMTAANSELANFGIVGSPAYDALARMPK
jgi:hypothetical protein